ncbi:MAG: DNA glycosylase [Clostridia bacterium]|nr:DNA glycosylase [Clostridia bacterium]
MRVTISDEIDLWKIINSGQCFRATCDDSGVYRFISGDKLLCMRSNGDDSFEVDCSDSDWAGFWSAYFDLGRNYASLRMSFPSETDYFSRVLSGGTGIRILRQEPFETLITFIISQRKSIPAIKKAVELLCRALGEVCTYSEKTHLFPKPERIAEAPDGVLAACGLGYRLSYVKNAAIRVCAGLDLNALNALSDEELVNELKKFEGVGDKVASCTALFAYGRMGLAPIDVWIARAIENDLGGQNPFEGHKEYSGLLQQYMFFDAIQRKNSK